MNVGERGSQITSYGVSIDPDRLSLVPSAPFIYPFTACSTSAHEVPVPDLPILMVLCGA